MVPVPIFIYLCIVIIYNRGYSIFRILFCIPYSTLIKLQKTSFCIHIPFLLFIYTHIYKTSRRMFKQEQTGALCIFVGIFFQRSLSLSLSALSKFVTWDFFSSFFYIKISTLVQEFNFAWDEIHRASDLYHWIQCDIVYLFRCLHL